MSSRTKRASGVAVAALSAAAVLVAARAPSLRAASEGRSPSRARPSGAGRTFDRDYLNQAAMIRAK